jgi:hypothetical protein
LDIALVGDRIVVGGWFENDLRLGDDEITLDGRHRIVALFRR